MKLTHDQRSGIPAAVQTTRQELASTLTNDVGFDAKGRTK